MSDWKNFLAPPLLSVFLSILIGVANFLDTATRLFYFYTSTLAYPLSTYMKPVFFVLQTALLVYFIKKIRFSSLANSIDKKFHTLMDLQLVLITLVIMLYFDSIVGNYVGIGLPKMYMDASWLLLFIAGPALTASWIGVILLKRSQVKISAVFFVVGVAFLGKPLESLYFWSQTYTGYVLPYTVVAFGMFAPHLLMASAIIIAVVILYLRAHKHEGRFSILRTPYVYTVAVAALIPVTLSGVREGLPNTIIRAVVYWGLGYSGFDWYAVGVYLFSFSMYVYIIKQFASSLDRSLASNLIKLGFASFLWNGVTIMLFGYSSIPGNILSLDAVAVGLSLYKAGEKTEEPK